MKLRSFVMMFDARSRRHGTLILVSLASQLGLCSGDRFHVATPEHLTLLVSFSLSIMQKKYSHLDFNRRFDILPSNFNNVHSPVRSAAGVMEWLMLALQ